MLVLTEVQYLHSQQFESINCDILDVQEIWLYMFNLSDFVKILLIGERLVLLCPMYVQCIFICMGQLFDNI